ncbi:MAG: peptidase [Geminicoccaceae bacterium]|nr:peptidase [Geminicoccaceae bacterium]
MTYCVGLALAQGLVMLADTRTSAGSDNISSFSKLFLFEEPGERVVTLMCAGNLAITQSAMNLLVEGIDDGTGNVETILTVPSMFKAAQLTGRAVRAVYEADGAALKAHDFSFDVSFLIGGQIKDRRMRLFQVYAAGNFIEATAETPYLQIGERKYGKPILDRALRHDMSLTGAVKLALVSLDSTLRSNLTVGLPAELVVYQRDSLKVALSRRITADDAYFNHIRQQWSESLREAYRALPDPDWGDANDLPRVTGDRI